MPNQKAGKGAKAKSANATKPDAVVIHGAHIDGEHHVVGLGNIRVVLIPDGNQFFAQGLEIDYAAQGSSLEEVKENFEKGLTATVEEHLRVYGNIEGLLTVAPNDAWKELVWIKGAQPKVYSQVTTHRIIRGALPYEGLQFIHVPAPEKARA